MPKFRCPRCGAIVEGLHDRCPRCNVLFKYRKEDMDLLTPYRAPVVEQPERIEEKPAPEPLPEPVPEPAPVVEEPAPEPEPVVEEPSGPSQEELEKLAKSARKFAVLGFVFALLHTLWYIAGLIPILDVFVLLTDILFLGFPLLLSFIFGLLGFIFSVKAIKLAKKLKEYKGLKTKKGLAVVALVLSILFFWIPLVLGIILICLLVVGGVIGAGVWAFITYGLPYIQEGSAALALLLL